MTQPTLVTPPPATTGSSGKWVLLVIVLLVAAGGAWFATHRPEAGGPPGGKPGDRKVPVLVEAAAQRDVPIVLEGLGTVTPLATVQVKAQVDGRLQSVAFKEGAVVHKGELLAQLDPRPFQIAVAQTAATLARDQAQLRNLKLTLERSRQLKEQNLVPQQQVDDQQTQVDSAEATVGIDQAANDNARLQLEYSRIVANIDGVAGIRQIDPGNLVKATDTLGLVVLTQLDPITVVFTVPQDELARVQRASAAGSLSVEAWARDGQSKLATGTLTVIDNQVSATTATVRLKATFENPTRALWPNEFVKARLAVEQRKDAVVIPAAAIQRGPQGTFVYLAGADDTAQVRPIEVDLIEGAQAILRSGVKVGERVITDGQSQLKPGAAIDARTPGATPPAGGAVPVRAKL
jgi:multidrug efflux system membrane fusion protein